jgi:hypothetical protein
MRIAGRYLDVEELSASESVAASLRHTPQLSIEVPSVNTASVGKKSRIGLQLSPAIKSGRT